MHDRLKRWLIVVPIIIAILLLVVLVQTRSGPQQVARDERVRPVRVITVPSTTVVPSAVGYGTVEPGTVWQAVAEVSGKVIERHPQFEKGDIIAAGAALLKIDPTDYDLTVAQAEASIRATEAQLAELEIREDNARIALAIEEEALRLGESELARKRKLVAQGTVTQSAFEQEQRSVLIQRQSVQSLKSTLSLIPAEHDLRSAELTRFQAQLQDARLDLERTVITMPFDGRVAEVNVEREQFVRQGDVLGTVDSIDVAEIAVQIPVARMRTLIQANESRTPASFSMASMREVLGLKARVYLRVEGLDVAWDAKFARLSDVIDPQTRTVGVIVAIERPYLQAIPGVRPPLVKGLFVEVELRGRARPDRVVVPRAALHGDSVFVVNEEGRLETRVVDIEFYLPNFAVVASGLAEGESLVVSDIVPAIEGMRLDPREDAQARASLLREALGEGAVR